MATRAPAFRDAVKRGALRTGALASALMLGIGIIVFALILGSYSPSDPSMNTAAAGPARNFLGTPGAWMADGLLTLLGPAIALVIPLFVVATIRLWRGIPTDGWLRRLVGVVFGIVLIDIGLALFRGGAVAGLPGGTGGVIGLSGADIMRWGVAFIPAAQIQPWGIYALIAFVTILGIIIWAKSLGIDADERGWLFGLGRCNARRRFGNFERRPFGQAHLTGCIIAAASKAKQPAPFIGINAKALCPNDDAKDGDERNQRVNHPWLNLCCWDKRNAPAHDVRP